MNNILEQFLDKIEVLYTKTFADTLYFEHPHRYNMYGLKKMLVVYGIKTIGVYIESKDLSELNFPCILHIHGDFVIGLDYNGDSITYLLHGKKTTVTHNVFKQTWTGNALVVTETTEATEPEYKKHKRDDMISRAKSYSIPVIFTFAAATGICGNTIINNIFQFGSSQNVVLVKKKCT